MLMFFRRVRSSRTQSMTLFPRATWYVSGFTVPVPNRFVRLLYTVDAVPEPGKMVPFSSCQEMTFWLFVALPWIPPICMKSGAAPAFVVDTGWPFEALFTQPAAMWSSDRPVGLASVLPALLAELSGAFGGRGWQVNDEPAGLVWGSFFWPLVPSKLHSFMLRMQRTISSLFANGAMGDSVVRLLKSSQDRAP